MVCPHCDFENPPLKWQRKWCGQCVRDVTAKTTQRHIPVANAAFKKTTSGMASSTAQRMVNPSNSLAVARLLTTDKSHPLKHPAG